MKTWRRFFERRRRDEELARELEAHLAHEIDEWVARGVPPDEARRRGAMKLGNRTAIREAVYQRNSLLSLESFAGDVRYGLRQLRRHPLFTAVAVVSLGLGIGASTAIFSLLDQSVLRTLPVPRPHELVLLSHPGPQEGGSSGEDDGNGVVFSHPVLRALEATPSFTAVAGGRTDRVRVAGMNAPARLTAERVSGRYFDVFRLSPALGRLLGPDDDRRGAPFVAVLSYSCWSSRFGSDPSAVGRTLVINDRPTAIVGVAPRGFTGQRRNRPVDLFVPLAMAPEIDEGWDPTHGFDNREYHWIPLIARLRPGVTRAQAEADVNHLYRREIEKDLAARALPPERQAQHRAKRVLLSAGAYGRNSLSNHKSRQLYVAQAAALLLVLLACANVAGVQVGRSVARSRETLVRLALGAPRAALVRQLLVESALIGALGGTLGTGVALAGFPLLRASLPSSPVQALTTTLDGRVLAFSVGLSLLTVVLFGLYPALRSSRRELAAGIKDDSGQATAAPSIGRFRLAVAAGQVAVSLLLLIGAGLLLRTVQELGRIDLGMRPDGVFSFSVAPKTEGYGPDRIGDFVVALRKQLAEAEGIQAVTALNIRPISGATLSYGIQIEGVAPPPGQKTMSQRCLDVDAGFVRTFGMRIVDGRDFRGEDVATGHGAALVNESFAARYFPAADAAGRRFVKGSTPVEIVGIVRDAKYSRLRVPMEPVVYFLAPDKTVRSIFRTFYVRGDGSLEQMRTRLDTTAKAIDPNMEIRRLTTMRAQLNDAMSDERNLSSLISSFAAAATLLAGLGLYGVLAYNVTRRTREIGIRVALGAAARDVRRLLWRDLRWLLAAGGTLGIVGGLLAGRLLHTLLYAVHFWDVAALGTALLVLVLMTLAAAAGPARRAAAIDPVLALRHD